MSAAIVRPFQATVRTAPRRQVTVRATWQKLATLDELNSNDKKRVVAKTADGQKVLIQEFEGEIYAVSNRCTHLGLPLQGKVVGKPLQGGCIVCPFHNTAFDVKSGEVKGDWSPGFPQLPFVGKVKESKPLPTFETRVTDGAIEVNA